MTLVLPAVPAPAARGRGYGGMRGVRLRVASCADGFLPYRHLAVRVIDQALRDLAGPTGSRHDRESAREFLNGSPMLSLWCEVAEIDPHWLVIHLRKAPAVSD
jgi:hypothetical protein